MFVRFFIICDMKIVRIIAAIIALFALASCTTTDEHGVTISKGMFVDAQINTCDVLNS